MNTLVQQIFDCFPSGKYALTGLLRLMDIVESDQVETAAVECKAQPRLLINPAFVKQHAQTPEKLLMLVMHELHHVLLGHTRLCAKATRIDNFAFDCIINAVISCMFPQPEYLQLLTDFYSDRKFPECMLRPPAAFHMESLIPIPAAIRGLPPDTGKRFGELYQALYSETKVSYDEIRVVFSSELEETAVSAIPLLGGHPVDGIEEGEAEPDSPALLDTLKEMAREWFETGRGRSWSDLLEEATVTPRPVPGNRAILRGLLARLGDRANGQNVRRTVEARTLLPTAVPRLDRRTAVLHALGSPPMFYPGPVRFPRKTRAGCKVHVYVDVSGSMGAVLPAIYGAVWDCRGWVYPRVHAFSTVVRDLALDQFQSGRVVTTGGTDIRCVAEHMAAHKVSRACILTDGMVGKPENENFDILKKAQIGVAAMEWGFYRGDLSEVVDHVVELKG